MTAFQLINEYEPEIPKLWDPFVGKTNVHGLIGPSDTGKSTLLRQLAIAVVRGNDSFLGYKLNTVHRSAIYVSLEDDEYALREYFHLHLNGENEENLKNLKLIFSRDQALDAITDALLEAPADLVIIDPWSALVSGSTNNLVDVRESISQIRDLSREFECAFILLHHNVKNAEKQQPDKNKANGTQAFEASIRMLQELRNDPVNPNLKILSTLKGNHLSNSFKEESIILEFDETDLRFHFLSIVDRKDINSGKGKYNDDRKPFLECAAKFKKQGIPFSEIPKKVADEFPGKKIPSATWFKENLKDDKIDPSVET